jgi:hypothetical protein
VGWHETNLMVPHCNDLAVYLRRRTYIRFSHIQGSNSGRTSSLVVDEQRSAPDWKIIFHLWQFLHWLWTVRFCSIYLEAFLAWYCGRLVSQYSAGAIVLGWCLLILQLVCLELSWRYFGGIQVIMSLLTVVTVSVALWLTYRFAQ